MISKHEHNEHHEHSEHSEHSEHHEQRERNGSVEQGEGLEKVLVVGAGLAGLLSAAYLLKQGIYPTIIDAKFGPSRREYPIFLNAQSRMLLKQIGIVESAALPMDRFTGISLPNTNGGPLATSENPTVDRQLFPFSSSGEEHAIYACSAKSLEQQLIALITSQTCSIRWGIEAKELREKDNAVELDWIEQERNGAQRQHTHDFDWVVVADGATGHLFQHVGLKREEATATTGIWRVGNRQQYGMDTIIPFDKLSGDDSAFAELKPNQSLGSIAEKNPELQLIGRHIALRVPLLLSQSSPAYYLFTTLSKQGVDDLDATQRLPLQQGSWNQRLLNTQLLSRMNSRRCFFVGDTAHNHLPISALPFGETLLDVANLTWKLAGTVKGRVSARLLGTYHLERHPRANEKGNALRRDFELAMSLFAVRYLPGAKSYVQRLALSGSSTFADKLRHAFFAVLAGDATHYRHTPLSVDYSGYASELKSGDPFPLMPLFDERQGVWTHTEDLFTSQRFVLVVLGKVSDHLIQIWRQWIQQKYPAGLSLYYIPFSARNEGLFEYFGLGPAGAQMVLVRPDGFIAYRTGALNTFLIDTYFEEVLGWKSTRRFE